MVDADLAALYGVETRSLVQAVKRNIQRFPSDFMFQLNEEEFETLRSQFVISKGKGGRRYLPYVFTEQGVAMLSSVLRSERAIKVNIEIMRVFVRLRELMASHKELTSKLKELEGRIQDHDEQIVAIFEAIRQLIAAPDEKRKKIGFEVKEGLRPIWQKGKKSKALLIFYQEIPEDRVELLLRLIGRRFYRRARRERRDLSFIFPPPRSLDSAVKGRDQ